MSATLHIFTGAGPALGTGHLRRMRTLHGLLEPSAAPAPAFARIHLHARTDITDAQTAATELLGELGSRPTASGDVILLDLRDVDPNPFRAHGPVLALDNRHPLRDRSSAHAGIAFHDTLPHPLAALEDGLARMLIAPELITARDERNATRGEGARADAGSDDIFAYSGSASDVSELDAFLLRIARANPGTRVLRVGTVAPERSTGAALVPGNFQWVDRLTPQESAVELLRARTVLAYFGMTFFEAWFVGAVPILFSIASDVHDTLSRDFARRSGAAFVESGGRLGFSELERRLNEDPRGLLPRVPPPDGRGYARLVAALHDLAQATD